MHQIQAISGTQLHQVNQTHLHSRSRSPAAGSRRGREQVDTVGAAAGRPFRLLMPLHGAARRDRGTVGGGTGIRIQETHEEGKVLSIESPTSRTPASCGGAGGRRRTGTHAIWREQKQMRTDLQTVRGFLQIFGSRLLIEIRHRVLYIKFWIAIIIHDPI